MNRRIAVALSAMAVTTASLFAQAENGSKVTRTTASPTIMEISEKNKSTLDRLGDYPNLKVLWIDCFEDLQSLPDTLGKLTELEELTVAYGHGNGCNMNPILPESIGNLRSLRKLILFGAQNPDFHEHEAAKRHEFPRSMSQLKNIIYLDLGGNGLKEVPLFVKDLPKLREIGFEYNGLKEVPSFLSKLPALTTLKLAGNNLSDLPDSLTALRELTRITLGNSCKITQNPAQMKTLRRRFPKVKFDFDDEYDCPDQ